MASVSRWLVGSSSRSSRCPRRGCGQLDPAALATGQHPEGEVEAVVGAGRGRRRCDGPGLAGPAPGVPRRRRRRGRGGPRRCRRAPPPGAAAASPCARRARRGPGPESTWSGPAGGTARVRVRGVLRQVAEGAGADHPRRPGPPASTSRRLVLPAPLRPTRPACHRRDREGRLLEGRGRPPPRPRVRGPGAPDQATRGSPAPPRCLARC